MRGMDDLSIHALQSSLVEPLVAQAEMGASPATEGPDFQSLLTMLLMGSGLGGNSDQNPLAGDLMMPVLVSLIEKLSAQEQGQASHLTGSSMLATVASTLAPNMVAVPSLYDVQAPGPHGAPLVGQLTQGFHPGHKGLDFGVVVGTQVEATMDGKVVYAGWNDQGYGNLVIVENGPYRTYYAHLSQVPVSLGQSVRTGQVIGLSGNTGRSTGPHLHYEVRRDGYAVDPTSFTMGSGDAISVSK